jgi:hypothetical protein
MSDLEAAIQAAVKGNVAVFYPCECHEHETGQEHFIDQLAAAIKQLGSA